MLGKMADFLSKAKPGPIRIKLSETIKCDDHECPDEFNGRCYQSPDKMCPPRKPVNKIHPRNTSFPTVCFESTGLVSFSKQKPDGKVETSRTRNTGYIPNVFQMVSKEFLAIMPRHPVMAILNIESSLGTVVGE
jgi:hypothetical protein